MRNFSYIRTYKVSEQGQGPKYSRFWPKRASYIQGVPKKTHLNIYFLLFFYIFLLIFMWKLWKNQLSGFRNNLGCVPYAQNRFFLFKIYEIQHNYSAPKKTTAMVFI